MYVVYVNGYGIPKRWDEQQQRYYWNRADYNYTEYIRQVADYLRGMADIGVFPLIVLAGGATNPDVPDMTEAMCMYKYLVADHWDVLPKTDLRFIHGMTLEENFEGFTDLLREYGSPITTMFCEWPQQDYFRYLASRHVPYATVYPLTFDQEHPAQWSTRLRHIAHLPVRIIRQRRTTRAAPDSPHSS
jgi:hypothetical protein